MRSLQRLSKQKPFLFFSAILLIYTVLQLLISYHIIETEFSDTHHSQNIIISHKQQAIDVVTESNYYTSNTFEGCDPIAIDYKWGKQFKNQKIACIVLSLYPRNKILMQFIGETYGKLCDGLFFVIDDSIENNYFNKTMHETVNRRHYEREDKKQYELHQQIINSNRKLHHLSTYFGGTVIQLNLTRPSHHTQRNTWEKVHRMYTYFYTHYLNDYDWFVRIDDDVLVSLINLRDYLSYFRTNDDNDYYIGHTLLDRWKSDNIVYNAGNLHAMNRNILRKLGPLLLTLPTAHNARDSHAHCMDFIAGNDDPHLGTCLNALGIYPINTLDYELKNRFMVFTNADHYNIKKEESWYWKERPFEMGALSDCCNVFALNDHPWIHIGAHLEWRLRFTQMSEAKWNNVEYINGLKNESAKNGKMKEVTPPMPCSFMYNINKTHRLFSVDSYYNINENERPKGQRIAFDSDNVLNCHKCEIGNKKDIYWTNEWDRTGLIHKINEKNKLKFYEISKKFPNGLISTRFEVDETTHKFISNQDDEHDSHKLQLLIDQALTD